MEARFVQIAENSVKAQSWANVDFIKVMNTDRKATIGQCWNEAVKYASGKFVLFVGDDDFIAPEFVQYFVDQYIRHEKQVPGMIGLTCYCLRVNEAGDRIGYTDTAFTGFFTRDFVRENPFNELLPNKVDTEYHARIRKDKMINLACIPHYFGYYYRAHQGMVSGYERLKLPE